MIAVKGKINSSLDAVFDVIKPGIGKNLCRGLPFPSQPQPAKTSCGTTLANSVNFGMVARVKSRAIDGYISDEIVFLDTNFNRLCNEDEPVSVTNPDGSFDLQVGPIRHQ